MYRLIFPSRHDTRIHGRSRKLTDNASCGEFQEYRIYLSHICTNLANRMMQNTTAAIARELTCTREGDTFKRESNISTLAGCIDISACHGHAISLLVAPLRFYPAFVTYNRVISKREVTRVKKGNALLSLKLQLCVKRRVALHLLSFDSLIENFARAVYERPCVFISALQLRAELSSLSVL